MRTPYTPLAASGPSSSPSSSRCTLLTYNVNWEVDPEPGIAAILRNNADIVCLQETNGQLQGRFEAGLRQRYPFAVFLHSATRTGGGSAFFSRVPGERIAHVVSRTGWFDALIYRFATSVGPVQVLNVHLRPPICPRRERFSVRAWLTTAQERQREIEYFCRSLRRDCATLIVGDFNEERGRAISWIAARGYRDALHQHQPHAHTWWWQWGPLRLRRRFDRIFHCDRLACDTAHVVRAGASDHWPVVARFRRAVSDN